MQNIVIPLATGFEEIEAISLIDILRRAELNVISASLTSELNVKGAHDIFITADKDINTINSDDIDVILLPGGGLGTKNLSQNTYIQTLLKDLKSKDKIIGAICAAPFALHTAGVLSKNYTCYPSFEKKIGEDGYKPEAKIVEEDNILTSRGPATAMDFALYLVKKFAGDEKYTEVKLGLLVKETL